MRGAARVTAELRWVCSAPPVEHLLDDSLSRREPGLSPRALENAQEFTARIVVFTC